MAGLVDLRPYGHGGLGEDVPRARGFDPASVEFHLLTIQGFDQQFGVFIPKTPSGEARLREGSYYRVEVPLPNGETAVYYMDREQYEMYLQDEATRNSLDIAHDAERLANMSRNSDLQRRALAAIGDHMLFASPEVSFNAKEILPRGPNVSERDRENARAVLRRLDCVAQRLPGSGREIWMTGIEWDAYIRAGGEIYTEK